MWSHFRARVQNRAGSTRQKSENRVGPTRHKSENRDGRECVNPWWGSTKVIVEDPFLITSNDLLPKGPLRVALMQNWTDAETRHFVGRRKSVRDPLIEFSCVAEFVEPFAHSWFITLEVLWHFGTSLVRFTLDQFNQGLLVDDSRRRSPRHVFKVLVACSKPLEPSLGIPNGDGALAKSSINSIDRFCSL